MGHPPLAWLGLEVMSGPPAFGLAGSGGGGWATRRRCKEQISSFESSESMELPLSSKLLFALHLGH